MLQMAVRIALFIVALVLLPQASEARIYRSCKGQYKVTLLTIDDAPVRGAFSIPQLASPSNPDCTVEYSDPTRLVARGGCGDTVPNLCRNRARDELALCTQVHWANNSGPVPWQCNSIPGYAQRVGIIWRLIERGTCCPDPKRKLATIEVAGEIWGNTGCGDGVGPITSSQCGMGPDFRVIRFGTFKIDCAAVQKTCAALD
jgi:hypothetical protein